MADELFAIVHFVGVYMLDSLVEMSDADFEHIVKTTHYACNVTRFRKIVNDVEAKNVSPSRQ